MKKWSWKKGVAACLGLILSIQAPVGMITPIIEAHAYTERTAAINASSLNVRSGPGTTYGVVTKLSKSTAVTVMDETRGQDGKLWYRIRFSGSSGEMTGYVLNTYVRFPVAYTHDSDFEAYLSSQGFPDSYKDSLRQLHAQYPNWIFEAQNTGLDWNTVIQNEGVLGRNLVHKNSISSYKSLMNGAYNWDNSTWTGFDGSSWVAASEEVLCHYMDPRNFLDEVYVFQFLVQGYDASLHNREGLTELLKGTFMEHNASVSSGASGATGETAPGPGETAAGPGGGQTSSGVVVSPGTNSGKANQTNPGAGASAPTGGQDQVSLEAPHASISKKEVGLVASSYGPGMVGAGPGVSAPTGGNSESTGAGLTGSVNYADIIMNAASQSGVNPYVIAAMIIQEQGSKGQSGLISGSYSGYEGYYNFFNVEAYQSGNMSAVQRGLWYASQSGNYGRPWDSPEKAIVGGAQFYGTNYIKAGQDTFYLKKYNVQGTNMYKHQYMTNVEGAASEAALFAEAYGAGLKNTTLRFKVPVYSNMPKSPCPKPVGNGSPNNKLKDLGAEGFQLTPTFSKDINSYDLIVDHSVSNLTIYANAIDSTAKVTGGGAIQLQSGNNDIKITIQAQNGSVKEYVIHVVRQSGGPTYNAGFGGGTGQTTPSGGGGSDPSGGPGASGGPGVVTAPSGGTGQPGASSGGSDVSLISPAG